MSVYSLGSSIFWRIVSFTLLMLFGFEPNLELLAEHPRILSSQDGSTCTEETKSIPNHRQKSSQVKLPGFNSDMAPVRIIQQDDVTLELDFSRQILSLSIPKLHGERDAGAFEHGDSVVVLRDGTLLQSGTNVVATLKSGQILGVRESRDEWLFTGVVQNGRTKRGWVQSKSVKFVKNEPLIDPQLNGMGADDFVSLAALIQKAKQFDDGLYATIEILAQEGTETFPGKKLLLVGLARKILQESRNDAASQIVLAAVQLGQLPLEVPRQSRESINGLVNQFLAVELRSKPMGFYTWNQKLTQIFQQDRMLQTPIKSQRDATSLLKTLEDQPQLLNAYSTYLRLVSKLTNPLAGNDLRAADSINWEVSADSPFTPEVAIVPPSRSQESDLFKRLGAQVQTPNFDLFAPLITRIRSSEITLRPTDSSGWYDYQAWSLEPLVIPDRTPEAKHLQWDEDYRGHMEQLFKGSLALARETHIKQLELPKPAAEAPDDKGPVIVHLSPILTVEPLPTLMFRRAAAYGFVRAVLEESFGQEALLTVRRETANGPVQMSLWDELNWVETLFTGAAITASIEIGVHPSQLVNEGIDSKATAWPQAKSFLDWAANIGLDPDLGRDCRMMVPVSHDPVTGKIRVWVFLGWSNRTLDVSFRNPPAFKVTNGKAEVHFHGTQRTIQSPIAAELQVTHLMNREEFRQHCDTYITREAILKNLK